MTATEQTPKVGDRVRVVLEGKVTRTLQKQIELEYDPWLIVTLGAPGVASWEILSPPVKVGDVLHKVEQVEALPVGAMIHFDGLRCFRIVDGWMDEEGSLREPGMLMYPSTVLYLPGGEG